MTDDPVTLTITDTADGRAARLSMPRGRAEAVAHELLGRCWPLYLVSIDPPEPDREKP